MFNRNSIVALAAVAALAAAALAPTSASAMRGGFGGGGHGFGGGARSFGGFRSFGGGFTHTATVTHFRSGPTSFARGNFGGGRHWGHQSTGCVFRCGNPPGTPSTPPYIPVGTTGNGHCLIDCGGTPPNKPPCFVGCGPNLPPPVVWQPPHHHHPEYAWHRPHWGVVDVDATDDTPVSLDGTASAFAAVTPGNCNCLTKQYLDDGSVLFKDICKNEAALATPDELRAQARGVAPQAQAR